MTTNQATTTTPAIVEPFDSTFLERAVRDPSFSVEKVSALLAERAKLQHEVQRRAYYAGLAAVQDEIGEVIRDKDNQAFKSKYATLEALYRVAKPVYTAHGFSITFGSLPPSQPGFLRVSCIVAHRDGHYEQYELEAPVSAAGARGGRIAMTDIQAVGAAVTYLRRYLFMMVFNLVQADDPNDDDGNSVKPKSGLMDRSVQQTVNQAAAPKQENGNGNGHDEGGDVEERLERRFDDFQRLCDEVTTVDEFVEKVIKNDTVLKFNAWLNKYAPERVSIFRDIRDRTEQRLKGGGDPVADGNLIP